MAGPFASLQQLVQNFESGGNYQAQSQTSSASGAYQMLDSTWLAYAPGAGVDTNQYPTAGSAPAGLQDATFASIVQQRGLQDWTCPATASHPACNQNLIDYLAVNPSQANLPTFAGGTSPASGGLASPSPGAGPTPATGTNAAGPSAGAGFYIIALILVVFLLLAGTWGLVRG